MDNLSEQINNLQVGDFVLVKIDGEPTWFNVIRFIGKNELVGIPMYEETYERVGNQPQVRIFKQTIMQCKKLKDWKDPRFFTWLAVHKIV